ncbi:MAG: tRNA (adenosine(37)-N6)-threonylcarbamoyltransferase complex dimerization subunit type 1 TsaB [Myxococcaceae bacterium]
MLLALDSSTLTLSLALVERHGGEVYPREVIAHAPPRKQSQMLPGVLDELLGRHGVRLGDLEGLAVGLGPGSFTGLRIGLATVKALAYAARLPLGGASSLAAVALEGPEGRVLLTSAVARAGELYVGRYRREGARVEALSPEDAYTPEELARMLLDEPGAVALGPSIAEYRERLVAAGAPAERLLDEPSFPKAQFIARLTQLPDRFDAQALFALEPHYVRASGAERNPKFPALPGPEPTSRLV